MKARIWALTLVTVLAACRGGADNSAAANNAAAVAPASNGLTVPGPPPATGPTEAAQQTAMPPGLDCVRNRLTPEERRAAAAVAMEQGSPQDPRAVRLVEATNACGEEMSWSPQKRRFAGMFSMAAAGAAGLRETLGARGISFDELDQAILNDRELMAAAEAGTLGDGPAGREFAMRHLDVIQRMTGGRDLDQETGTRIGNYIAFRAMAEVTARQFGQQP